MDLINNVEAYYGVSESSVKLRENLEARINQTRPKTGHTFTNTVGWGQGKLYVTAGGYDEYVTLMDCDAPTKVMTFYVRAGETATLQVKDRRYVLEYIGGNYWFGQNSLFGEYYEDAGSVNGDLVFSTERQGSQAVATQIEVDLGNLSSGDWSTPGAAEEKPIESPVKSAYASTTYTGDRASHDVTNLLDGDKKTNWTEGSVGSGTGEVIEFQFWDEYFIKSITIYAGNQYDRNRYLDNNRPENIYISFPGHDAITVTLRDVMEGQTILLPESVVTDTIWITLGTVYPGSKYDDTVISDISFEAYTSAFH